MTLTLDEIARLNRVQTEDLRGPRGPEGERGPEGPEGESGPQGAVGPIGPKGRDGVDGRVGGAGRDGKDGTSGRDGKDGKDGKPGPAGEEGLPGKDGVGADEHVAVSADDPTPGFLADKLEAGQNISLTRLRRAGGERLVIDALGGTGGGFSIGRPGAPGADGPPGPPGLGGKSISMVL